MAQREQPEEREVEIYHPNRDKPTVKATRAGVIVLLLASIALMVLITVGGWSALAGMKPVQIAYIIVYVILVIFALRWSRGILATASALAVVLGIFALVAFPGWFDRDHTGYSSATLPSDLLGLLTIAIIPVQILLIVFCLRGFAQGWNVEEERRTNGRASSQPGSLGGPSAAPA